MSMNNILVTCQWNPGYMSVKYGYFYYIYRVKFDVGNEADAWLWSNQDHGLCHLVLQTNENKWYLINFTQTYGTYNISNSYIQVS